MVKLLDVGSQLAGYRLLRLIGQGGTGLVYEAEHIVLGRSAALKMLLPELVDELEYRERLLRESRTVAALDHPAVIPIYDAGEVEGVIYVAMRLVRGSDLREHLTREGRLDLDAALTVLEQVAGALDAAHREGLVHRDVKPANVLLEEGTARVFLTDFGIAKQAHAPGLTRTGFFVGTVDYAAPEQIQGNAVGPLTDVYAFGCLLYECLAGRPPFGGTTVAAIAQAHLFDPPPALPPELDLPSGLDDVLARALSKSGSERHPSCRALVAEARVVSGGTSAGRSRVRTVPLPETPARVSPPPLPAETSPLLGRTTELDRICELLRSPDVRLVTLTGLGGTGKTRLVVAVARAVADEFDEVAFADLSLTQEPAGATLAIGKALGVQDLGGESVAEVLAWRLADRSVLLVLDSFERVLSTAPLLSDLLHAAPGLVVVVTSQAPLRLPQEHQFPVQPLPLPDATLVGDIAALADVPAVRLFLDRARAVRPGFELSAKDAPAIVGICTRLDGLPLAIELAAARVSLLSPQAILSRLEQRFELLTDRGSAAHDRHRTLKDAIDWTYSLLDDDDKALLARLSVFAGSWSLEAADVVCGTPGSPRIGEMLNAFASLVDKSLIRQSDGFDGEPRFGMLETIQYYARDRLEERDEREVIQSRHARRYLTLVETAEPELVGQGQIAWLAKLDEESDNIRAALTWLCEHGPVELALRMAGSLVRYWSLRGQGDAGRRQLELALASSAGVSAAVVSKAQFAAGYAALGQGDFGVAGKHFEKSLQIARSIGDTRREAAALVQLGWLSTSTGRYEEAREKASRSLTLLVEVDDIVTTSGAYSVLAAVAGADGDDVEAMRLFEQALRLRRELGDPRLIANSILDLARKDIEKGQPDRATGLLEEAMELARKVDDGWSITLSLSTLGALAIGRWDDEEARRLFTCALEIARQRGDKRVSAECVVGLAAAAGLSGDPRRSARLLGAARALRALTTAGPSSVERMLEEMLSPQLQAALGGVFEVEVAAGGRLSVEETLLLALDGVTASSLDPMSDRV